MANILVFDKGGRKERINLIKKNQAPRDFFQGMDFLKSNNFDIEHLSSSIKYKKNMFYYFGRYVEQFFCKLSNIGIRPLSVFQFRRKINQSQYVVSFTDGFSISLGFYYSFLDKNNTIKLVGAFHKLSDYDTNLPTIFKKLYYEILKKVLNRLDLIVFYGPADRENSINHFNLNKNKTFIIKFGVDTMFWHPNNKQNFYSNYLFSIGQDPSRDFQTLLKVRTEKRIHIHTNLLDNINKKNLKITNGTYNKFKNSLSDLKIRKLYQEAFAIIVPLKDVFQPSGYSVTLQAMACGKPVILTLTKGLWAPKVFENLKNCILVSPNNPIDIEKAIEILEMDPQIYRTISKEARQTAKKYFSLEVANKSTLNIFEKLK